MIGIDMKMPDSCAECEFIGYDYWDGYSCKINGECLNSGIDDNINEEYKNERHLECPLIDLDKENDYE